MKKELEMDSGTAVLVMILLFLLIVGFIVVLVVGVGSAYKNGVRDGYQNTWLPHVQNQIREQKLTQGDEVRDANDYRH